LDGELSRQPIAYESVKIHRLMLLGYLTKQWVLPCLLVSESTVTRQAAHTGKGAPCRDPIPLHLFAPFAVPFYLFFFAAISAPSAVLSCHPGNLPENPDPASPWLPFDSRCYLDVQYSILDTQFALPLCNFRVNN
jgi:hypothetical protein